MKYLFFLFLLFFINNCNIQKVVKHHGIHFLDKKQKTLELSISNKNDVREILGPPSTKNTFDNEIWIYMERKTTVSDFKTLGRKKLLVNNVLILEFDNRGILIKKDFFDKDSIKNVEISENETAVLSKKNNFIKSVLNSLKRKINDPLGKKTIN